MFRVGSPLWSEGTVHRVGEAPQRSCMLVIGKGVGGGA